MLFTNYLFDPTLTLINKLPSKSTKNKINIIGLTMDVREQNIWKSIVRIAKYCISLFL